MRPLKALKDAVKALESSNARYCLVGGHAASLYRTQARVTRDVDFALVAQKPNDSLKTAEQIIRKMGLRPVVGFIPPRDAEGNRTSVCMVTSTPPPGELTGIIDILLPTLPWVASAVERAQYNKLDLGFAAVPVITPEDLIIAKCYALKHSPDRFQDLDDLKEIFSSTIEFDWDYVRREFGRLRLSIPVTIKKYAKSAGFRL